MSRVFYIERMTATPLSPVTEHTTSPSVSPRAATPQRALAVLALRPALLLLAALAILTIGTNPAELLYLNVVIVVVDAITIAVLVRLTRSEGRRLRDLIGAPRPTDIAWGLLALLIVAVGLFLFTYVGNLVVYGGAPPASTDSIAVPMWLALVTLIVMPVTVAFAEELAYRGYAQSALTAHGGRWIAVATMALFFGLQHAAISMESPQAALARFITTALAGLLFGVLVWWFRRLTPIIAGHWLVNVLFLGLPLVALAVAS